MMVFTRFRKLVLTRAVLGLAVVLSTAQCGDDGGDGMDEADGSPPDDGGGPIGADYVQIEQLARPGIAEVLLLSQGFLAGYNAAAPTFTGVPAATVDGVVGEAKTVLKALYLGPCLLNGALGLTPDQGVKPAGITCHAVGPAVWEENALDGVTLTAASQDAAQVYADKVASQFLPDVMRIDTSVDSAYLTLCGDANTTPLLCGGRNLNDDIVDVTYNYFINGAGSTKGAFDQVRALTSDGVQFSSDDAKNASNVTLPVASNTSQFHGDVSATFPYSAAPL